MAVQTAVKGDVRIEPKSSHVEDTSLQPFLQDTFDAADYLNATLPSLTFSNAARDAQATRVSLAELATRTQGLMSQLNAQTSRLTNTLNQLTDEILRSGSRLAYEVEVLRGETAGLSDALNDGLQEEICHFIPGGLSKASSQAVDQTQGPDSDEPTDNTTSPQLPTASNTVAEPEYINKLRTLTHIRARLETVIQTFGTAMQWPVAPSEVTSGSSFISVSAPSSTTPEASRDLEEKGKDYAQKLRLEISQLLESASTAEEGVNAAMTRIGELRELAEVWKGTAEEKARARLIEGLMKPIEDEQKALLRKMESKRRTASPSAQVDYRYGDAGGGQGRQGGYGLFKGLAKLKDDIYLD